MDLSVKHKARNNLRVFFDILRSLSVRMSLSIVMVGSMVSIIIIIIVTNLVKTTVYNEKVNEVLYDANVHIEQIRRSVDKTTITSIDELEIFSNNLLEKIRKTSSTTGSISVFFYNNSDSSYNYGDSVFANYDFKHKISDRISNDVEKNIGSQWQYVVIPSSTDARYPGVIVGNKVKMPLIGYQQFYIVYSFEGQKDLVNLITYTVIVSFTILLILLASVILIVSHRILRPIRAIQKVTQDISNGELEKRIKISGHDELSELCHSVNKMADSLQTQIDQLAKLSLLQQRFVSDVSHELRTPMTTIRIAGDTLYDSSEKFDIVDQRTIELLHSQIERFDSLLEDLLEISRYDSQSAELSLEELDMRFLVDETINNTLSLINDLNIEIVAKYSQYECVAEFDSRRIKRIIRNILFNAYEHAEGNPIEVVVFSNQETVCFRVLDHGVGMSEETVNNVFDRFYRADPSRKRTTGGSGLGLAIAMEDAKIHNGTIYASGQLNVGSIFMLVLPIKQNIDWEEPAINMQESDLEDYYDMYVKYYNNN